MMDKKDEFSFFCQRLKDMGVDYQSTFILWQIKNQLRDHEYLKKLRAIDDDKIATIYHYGAASIGHVVNIAETDTCISAAEDLYDLLVCDYYG